jgi:hypothetical protein
LIVHSLHFNDLAAIRRARTFAGDRRFEVWCERSEGDLERSLASSLVFRSFPAKPAVTPNPAGRIVNTEPFKRAQGYEFRLRSPKNKPMLFAGAFPSDDEATEHARRLLYRHSDMLFAEIWRGMKLVRQV